VKEEFWEKQRSRGLLRMPPDDRYTTQGRSWESKLLADHGEVLLYLTVTERTLVKLRIAQGNHIWQLRDHLSLWDTGIKPELAELNKASDPSPPLTGSHSCLELKTSFSLCQSQRYCLLPAPHHLHGVSSCCLWEEKRLIQK
jgi:hypothetical protein